MKANWGGGQRLHTSVQHNALQLSTPPLPPLSPPFPPQVMPPFLHVIRTCNKDMREYLFKQLGQIISIVKQHARSYMSDIFLVIKEFWNPSDTIQNTIILLVEKIVVAMGDELKVFIPPLVQPVLRLFLQDPSEQQIATQKVCRWA